MHPHPSHPLPIPLPIPNLNFLLTEQVASSGLSSLPSLTLCSIRGLHGLPIARNDLKLQLSIYLASSDKGCNRWIASFEVCERPRNTASVEEAVTCGRSFDDQETAPYASTKVYPVVEREVEGHPRQWEFEYTSKPANGELSGWNSSQQLSLPLMYARTR